MIEKINGFVVLTNTDLTEGKGRTVAISYTLSRAVAERKAKGRGVMGSNAYIEEVIFTKEGYKHYGELYLDYPTKEDQAKDYLDEKKRDLLNKVQSLGLTEEELKLLKAGMV